MTLCVAYIRQAGETDELVFGTDSCLTGGEKWTQGIKLFELPRKDCLLCFTGSTIRAYPLILNLVSSIHLDEYLRSPSARLQEVLTYVADLFSTLVKTITEVGDHLHEERGAARFLFGGWDWQQGEFKVWKLSYSSAVEGFVYDELTATEGKTRFYEFIGEASGVDIEQKAKQDYKKYLSDNDKFDDSVDMGPLLVLRDISLDKTIREVDGSLQIAKVYKSGRTEFFGTYWESSKGYPCFQGREYREATKPAVRYLDPDTFSIYEADLPGRMEDISEVEYGESYEIVRSCYDDDGHLLTDLGEQVKHNLRLIFKDIAYRRFLASPQTTAPASAPDYAPAAAQPEEE